MGFSIKVPDGLRNLAYVFGRKIDGDVKREFEKALEEELAEISKRTREGRDFENKPFERYADATKAAREKRGRQVSRVDLTFTGRMLQGMRSKVDAKNGYLEGTLFFLSSQRVKARANQEGRQDIDRPPRRFFGLSKEQVIRITKRMKDALNVRR